jgi:hypothetical protein
MWITRSPVCWRFGQSDESLSESVSVPASRITVVAIVAGLVLVFTIGSLLGAALIIGGIGGLGVAMIPGLLERFASWLGGAGLRRW